MNETQKFYDLTAESSAKEWYGNNVLLPTLRDFLSLLPENPRVLDLGCGPGHESMRLHSLGAQVVGIDFSSECIRIARAKNPGCEFINTDFLNADEALGMFDGVLASGSLIHVSPERMPDLLFRLARLLSKRGVLAAIVQDGTGQRTSHPVIVGVQIARIVYLYRLQELENFCRRADIQYVRNGILDDALMQAGWRCYLFERRS